MLHAWTDSLWTFDMPLAIAGLHLGARMTIARLPSGDLALISPVNFTPADRDAIQALGTVRYVIAPNLMHYKYVPHAKEFFPSATVLAAPGLREKRPKLPIDAVLGASPEHDTALGLEQHLIGGMPKLNEVAILHSASRTLILTDLIFHFLSSPSWTTRAYLKLGGAYGKASQTLLLRSMVKEKAALRRSRDLLLKSDFDRVIVTHGSVVKSNGRETLKEALGWLD